MNIKVLYNEIDPYCCAWLSNLMDKGHIRPGVICDRSIADLTPDDVRPYELVHFFAGIAVWDYALTLAGWRFDGRRIWTGSCPCQPFSNAGKSLGHEDKRHLWPTWERLIRECRPVSIFGEQVASNDGLAWLDLVCTDLEDQGYTIGAVDLCAAGVGAPHIRQRLWFVAHTTGRGCGEQRRAPESRQVRHADGSDGTGVLDHAVGDGWGAQRIGRDREDDRIVVDAAGCDGRLADPIGPGLGIVGRGGRAGQEDARPHVDLDHDGRMGNAGSARLPPRERQEFPGTRGGDEGRTVEQPGRSFWADCEWVQCRDGKARPVEPGTFPLAHGAPARVGRLRAYGNAINAQAARAFIEAAADLMP